MIVRSDCECGYTVTQNDSSTSSQLYTDLIETNFLQEQNITQNTDWRVQTYAAKSQRPYARNVTKENVIANPLAESSTLDGPGILGGDPGLQLWVRGGPPIDNYVPSAEIATRRKDMLYGSIRLAAKMTSLNGTCSAMFTVSSRQQVPNTSNADNSHSTSTTPKKLTSSCYLATTPYPASHLNHLSTSSYTPSNQSKQVFKIPTQQTTGNPSSQ